MRAKVSYAVKVRLVNNVEEFRVYPEVRGKPMKSVNQIFLDLDFLLRHTLTTAWRRN